MITAPCSFIVYDSAFALVTLHYMQKHVQIPEFALNPHPLLNYMQIYKFAPNSQPCKLEHSRHLHLGTPCEFRVNMMFA